MEVRDKIINDNAAIQMNARQSAADRQGDLRHSVSQVRHDSSALSVKALTGQMSRNDPAVENAVNMIKESLKNSLISVEKYMNRGIRLDIENDLGILIVKIIDKESGEIIKQIPVADALELSKHLKSQFEEIVKKQDGLFVDKVI